MEKKANTTHPPTPVWAVNTPRTNDIKVEGTKGEQPRKRAFWHGSPVPLAVQRSALMPGPLCVEDSWILRLATKHPVDQDKFEPQKDSRLLLTTMHSPGNPRLAIANDDRACARTLHRMQKWTKLPTFARENWKIPLVKHPNLFEYRLLCDRFDRRSNSTRSLQPYVEQFLHLRTYVFYLN